MTKDIVIIILRVKRMGIICKDCKHNIKGRCKYDPNEPINNKLLDCGLYDA